MATKRTSPKTHRRTSTLDAATLAGVTEIFKILGDPTRMLILSALAQTNLCVQDIAREVGVTQSAISHQLRMLKTMRLVASKRTGKQIVYSLADTHVETLVRTAIKHYAE